MGMAFSKLVLGEWIRFLCWSMYAKFYLGVILNLRPY